MAFQLAEMFVDLTVRNFDRLTAALSGARRDFTRTQQAADTLDLNPDTKGARTPAPLSAPQAAPTPPLRRPGRDPNAGAFDGREGAAYGGLATGLREVIRQRRELMRLQRLAGFLDSGEIATAAQLGAVRMRLAAHTGEAARAQKEELNRQIQATAAARGYGAVTGTIFAGLVRVNAALGNFTKGLGRVRETLAPVSTVAGRAFAVLAGGVTSFVVAALRGTAEGNVLTQRFTLLSREVGSVFYPAIVAVIGGLERLIGFFREGLSPEARKFAFNLTLGAAAALGVAKVLSGPLLGAVEGVALGMQALTAVGISLNVWTGGLLLAAGAAVTALAALAVGTEGGRRGLSSLGGAALDALKALRPVGDVLMAAFEAFGQALGGSFADAMRQLRAVLGPLAREAMPAARAAAEGLRKALEEVRNALLDLLPDWGAFLKADAGGPNALAGALGYLKSVFDDLGWAVHQVRIAVEAADVAVEEMGITWGDVLASIVNAFDPLHGSLQKTISLVEKLNTNLEKTGALLKTMRRISDIFTGFGALEQLTGIHVPGVEDLVPNIADVWKKAEDRINARDKNKPPLPNAPRPGPKGEEPPRLTQAGRGFEKVEDIWKRIAAAGLGQDFDRQTALNTKKAAQVLQMINEKMGGGPLIVGPIGP